jgi:putative oxidoreductase
MGTGERPRPAIPRPGIAFTIPNKEVVDMSFMTQIQRSEEKIQRGVERGFPLLGRALLSYIFLSAGLSKLKQPQSTLEYMGSKGLPRKAWLLYSAAAVEILGGLSILSGTKARWGAAGLMAFLVPTTLVFHNFWKVEPSERQAQMQNFTKNLAILGGLTELTAQGSGPLSFVR